MASRRSRLTTDGGAVFLDPFHLPDAKRVTGGMRMAYPPLRDVHADLLLITHEHFDHHAAEAVGGDPQVIRSTPGTLDSPLGRVTAIASEHDPEAGTVRGPNTISSLGLRRPAGMPWRRLRPGGLAPGTAPGRRPRGFAAAACGRRSDHRRAPSPGTGAARVAALDGPDALPHPGPQLPGTGRRLPRPVREGASPGRRSGRLRCSRAASGLPLCRPVSPAAAGAALCLPPRSGVDPAITARRPA